MLEVRIDLFFRHAESDRQIPDRNRFGTELLEQATTVCVTAGDGRSWGFAFHFILSRVDCTVMQ